MASWIIRIATLTIHAKTAMGLCSAEFPLAEMNNSYYALPSERNSNLWVERTPDDFTFNVKTFRLFTSHPTQARALPRTVRDELPAELAGKRNLYDRDVPPSLRDRLWEMAGTTSECQDR